MYGKYLKASNTLLVCAAGNDARPPVPLSQRARVETVAVGALDTDATRAGYSNYGDWVDVWARGSDVVNGYPKGRTTTDVDPRRQEQPGYVEFKNGPGELERYLVRDPLVAGLVAARMSMDEKAHQAWAAPPSLPDRAVANGGVDASGRPILTTGRRPRSTRRRLSVGFHPRPPAVYRLNQVVTTSAGGGRVKQRYADFDVLLEPRGDGFVSRVLDSPVGSDGSGGVRPT